VIIEVVYALANKQKIYTLEVTKDLSAREAVELAPLKEDFPDECLDDCKLGIFGKMIKDDQQIRDGDRIEIYRPLIADPKEVRKQRAAAGKKLKKGGTQL
jgi:putative ubiquitin-RnfH superfamily antitoxin RatB of RatAB toxin-antitoxin module